MEASSHMSRIFLHACLTKSSSALCLPCLQRAFWQALLHHHVSFTALVAAVERLDKAVRSADQMYRSVLQKNSTSVKLLRLYAKFLHQVKHGGPGYLGTNVRF
jgi:hypothetical protein